MIATSTALPAGNGKVALSLLDFCESDRDSSAARGLDHTIEAAVLADRLGYRRYWLAEHWNAGVATPSPEVLTPVIAGVTERIRVGPAGVLLSFYSPLKVACNALLAEILFPGRTDLGLARGGAAPEVIEALVNGDIASLPAQYDAKVGAVMEYLEGRGRVSAYPAGVAAPDVWVLGSGAGSVPLAARHGCSFALSLFHARAAADPRIIQDYRTGCRPAASRNSMAASIAVAGFCSDSEATANRNALGYTDAFIRPNIIGTPDRWREEIVKLCRRFGVDEVVVLELSRDPAEHRQAIESLAEVFALGKELAGSP